MCVCVPLVFTYFAFIFIVVVVVGAVINENYVTFILNFESQIAYISFKQIFY